MKKILFLAISAFSFQSLAGGLELQPCTGRAESMMQTSIAEKQADGFSQIYLMINKNNEAVGFYAHDPEYQDGMYAEVCESIDSEELTVSSEFYYFEGNANPTSFKKGDEHYLSQDEGLARIIVLEDSQEGDVRVEFSVLGWDSESNEHVVRQSEIKFETYSK